MLWRRKGTGVEVEERASGVECMRTSPLIRMHRCVSSVGGVCDGIVLSLACVSRWKLSSGH